MEKRKNKTAEQGKEVGERQVVEWKCQGQS